MKKTKLIALFSILLCALIIMPATSAADNDTAIGDSFHEELASNDYYFDANIGNDDGNGSITNPYKTITSSRIYDNSVIHLADGEYRLGFTVSKSNLTIIGQNPSKSVLTNGAFSTSSSLTLKDVTINHMPITVKEANFTAVNCIFSNSTSKSGGAISADDSIVSLDNCTFVNDSAEYGGAIYLFDSNFNASDVYINGCSADFGGAIVALKSYSYITGLKAKENKAKYDGGAVYHMYGILNINASEFDGNEAENGAALFIDEVMDLIAYSNRFTNNRASDTAGAVYSSISQSLSPNSVLDKKFKNTFSNNRASVENDVYECSLPSLEIGDNDNILIRYNSSYDGSLPGYYSLRDLGLVTPVKNQKSGGNCWAFSTLAALESCILKATGISMDLSEENMKNLMGKYSDYGWDMETNEGGYGKMGIGYLTSWLGPVNESDDAYKYYSVLSPILESFIHVQNVLNLERDNYTDNDDIKRAIMEYGAVSTSIYWSSSYIKGSSYYYTGNINANHAVAIVGWDDSYSRDNFRYKPAGDGAWIIKNSHGTSSGDKGYYYVSYYDKRCAPINKSDSTFTFILNDTVRYDKNYQYDIQGRTDFFYNTTDTVWYKNKFTATANEYLAAVSTYFDKYTEWDLSVYVNNALKYSDSGASDSGYYTIDLNRLIPIKIGDVFEVVFKITVDGDAGFPISESVSLNREFYTEGISYLSYDGKRWKDMYDLEWTYPEHTYTSQVACIKAFTVLNKFKSSIELSLKDQYNPCEIIVKVSDEYGRLIGSGDVTLTVEGKKFTLKLQDGIAKLTYLFENPKNNVIKATFTDPAYVSSSASKTISLNEVIIKANDLVTYDRDNVKFTASLADANGKAVSGKELKFSVNNRTCTAKTNSKGIATINTKLAIGVYDIIVSFNDASTNNKSDIARKISVKSRIILPRSKYTYNSEYKVRIFSKDAKPVANATVNITINSKTYSFTTGEDGYASLTLRLKPKAYEFTISIDDEARIHNIEMVKRIDGNSDLTMYFGAGKYYKIKVFDDAGKPAGNVNVTMNINGKDYTMTSDADGWVSLKIGLKAGTYTITSTYKGYSVSNKITVKPTLVMSAKTVKRYSTFSYTVKLLDKNGNILKNKKITVTFKGVTYSAKTSSKGIATFKIRAYSNLGKYTLTATYGSAKISKTITVKK